MNWDYFIENGTFKAKRLPATKGTVKIKDSTDLYDLQDYLKEVNSIEEAIEAYEHCFDDHYMYEVEVETFEEYFDRNQNKFLGEVGKLKGKFSLIEELKEWNEEEQEYGWIFVDETLGKQLNKFNLAEVKNNIDEKDWIEFLTSKYHIQDMKAIGDKHSIPTKGNKEKIAKTLLNAIQAGLIEHDSPFLIRPGNKLEQWFGQLQVKFASVVDSALSSFDYPSPYISAVWDMVLTDNSEHGVLVSTIREKYGKYLPKEEPISSSKTRNKINFDDLSITITTEYSNSKKKSQPQTTDMSGTDIQFSYRNRNGENTTRIVNVNMVWKDNGLIYFKGYCKLRNEIRVFRIDGVEGGMVNKVTGEIVFPGEISSAREFLTFIESPTERE
jgi:hypothetical protein